MKGCHHLRWHPFLFVTYYCILAFYNFWEVCLVNVNDKLINGYNDL